MSPAPLIVFSHGNSFPASTYNVVFDDLRQRGFRVEAVEKFGHDPRYPVTNNWPHLVEQLSDFVKPWAASAPVFLVGHSLGGFLSLMTAAKHPSWVRGVVMLDSPLVAGWRASLLRVGKRLPMAEALSPGALSRNRRNTWADAEEAYAHFASKKVFARWDPRVLQDYVTHGTRDEVTAQGTRRVLSFDRDVETAIYNTLPDHIESYLRRHPLKCKAALIGGLQSRELKQVGLSFSQRITQGRVFKLDGTHLFPMERPHATAAAIEAALLNLMA
jgi:pimeloyl-ACP methyl ester carboxylesterase